MHKLRSDELKRTYQENKDKTEVTKFVIIDKKDKKKYPWKNFLNSPKWQGENLNDDFEFFWVIQKEIDVTAKIYLSAMDIWKKNKIFGNGIKSFRQDCKKLSAHKQDRLCSNHPHNYYLEILIETGILGFSAVLVIGLLFSFFIIKKFKFLNDNTLENLLLFAATISLILEAFPFKSTGSIFTTNNATYLILMASIIISHKRIIDFKSSK